MNLRVNILDFFIRQMLLNELSMLPSTFMTDQNRMIRSNSGNISLVYAAKVLFHKAKQYFEHILVFMKFFAQNGFKVFLKSKTLGNSKYQEPE